jgi:alpha-beta hydrolase superfamily lysophospholipase
MLPSVSHNRKKTLGWQKACWLFFMVFLLINLVAYLHAYTFTHFTNKQVVKTKDARALSVDDKLSTLIFGINNPRPINTSVPSHRFETIQLQSYKSVELWQVPATGDAKGTVILFHGYSGCKSGLLDKSDELLTLGYNTILVDFPGSGGSEGNQTTVGYKEAIVVKDCYQYVQQKAKGPVYLFGTSMGAVAVLKATHDYPLTPAGLILECPFGTMYETTANRFHTMHVPEFPFAPLLVFWGGVQNGFWAFSHNPVDYAKQVKIPALLLYGQQDEKVSAQETHTIYQNLAGPKQLVVFENAGHENYLAKDKDKWITSVANFIANSTNASVK